MPLPQRKRAPFGEATTDELIQSGIFRDLTPGEKWKAIGQGLLFRGGMGNAIEAYRGQRVMAPFQEMLAQESARPDISPERKLELEAMRAQSELSMQPHYQRDLPRRPFSFERSTTSPTGVPMVEEFGAIGREYPESYDSPDWQSFGMRPRYKRSVPKAGAGKDISKRETAAGFARFLGALPPGQARDIVGQASGADTMTAPSQAWLALIAENPELAAQYMKGTAPGAQPYAPGGPAATADDPTTWEDFRKRHPSAPEFKTSTPALRRLYLEQFQE